MNKIIIGAIIVLLVAGGVWYVNNQMQAPTATPTPISQASDTPTITPAPSSVSGATATPDTRCIITVDGQKYDVSSFRNQHPGGDVFQCGTDMSVVFHAQHGNGAKELRAVQNLKVN